MDATVAAAITSSTRCSPRSRMLVQRDQRCVASRAPASTIQPSSITVPSAIAPRRENSRRVAFVDAASAHRRLVVRVHHCEVRPPAGSRTPSPWPWHKPPPCGGGPGDPVRSSTSRQSTVETVRSAPAGSCSPRSTCSVSSRRRLHLRADRRADVSADRRRKTRLLAASGPSAPSSSTCPSCR